MRVCLALSFCLIQDGFQVWLVVVMVAFFEEGVSLKEGECCPFFVWTFVSLGLELPSRSSL